MEMSDEVLLVSVMSLPCLTNTKKLLDSFNVLGYPPLDRVNIVVNRYMKNSEITTKDAGENIHKKIFWTLPNDYQATMSAINNGKPLLQISPKASITRSIRELALVLTGQEDVEEKKNRWRLFGGRQAG
jgi:pilus assembly protein CpaE